MGLGEYGCGKMENWSFGYNRMGICREGSEGQNYWAVLKKKKKKEEEEEEEMVWEVIQGYCGLSFIFETH